MSTAITGTTGRLLMTCREQISRGLSAEMCRRPDADGLAWIENERQAVVRAANAWVDANDAGRQITADDVLAIEGRAVGHYDYQAKLSLYVAEFVLGLGPVGSGRSES